MELAVRKVCPVHPFRSILSKCIMWLSAIKMVLLKLGHNFGVVVEEVIKFKDMLWSGGEKQQTCLV